MFLVPWVSATKRMGGGTPELPFSFPFSVISTQTISGVVSTASGKTVTFSWGDSTTTDYTGTDQAWSKNYGSVGNRSVTVTGDARSLTKFTMMQVGANISFSPVDIPNGMIEVYIEGANTVTGDVGGLPKTVEVFVIKGTGTTSLSGNTNDLGPTSNLKEFLVSRPNTITGDVGLLPPQLFFFRSSYNCTFYGNIGDTPDINYYRLEGKNTESDYTTKTWPSNMDRFLSTTVAPGGLSSAEVDQLLIDLADTTWDPILALAITVTGTHAARTAASDSAVATLTGMGVTVTTS